MFELQEFTQARLATVTNRVEKHGDEDKPAVSLGVEITTANTLLDVIDPTLRQALYKAKPDAEPELPGVEQSTPVLRCNSIDRVTLPTAHEGWSLKIDDGIDETNPMEFGSVKVDKMSVEPKQGGSIVLRLRLGTSDIDAERLGKLGMHNGQDIWLQLLKPEPKPEAIDGTTGHPGAIGQTAEDLFAADAEKDIEDDEDAGPELEDRLDNALAMAGGAASKAALDHVGNPFGTREAELQAEAAAGAGTRTARGRAATKKALADGMAAAQAAGTVQ